MSHLLYPTQLMKWRYPVETNQPKQQAVRIHMTHKTKQAFALIIPTIQAAEWLFF